MTLRSSGAAEGYTLICPQASDKMHRQSVPEDSGRSGHFTAKLSACMLGELRFAYSEGEVDAAEVKMGEYRHEGEPGCENLQQLRLYFLSF
jgi:hypothetical protein